MIRKLSKSIIQSVATRATLLGQFLSRGFGKNAEITIRAHAPPENFAEHSVIIAKSNKELILKKLPAWSELIKNFPNKEAKDVFSEIGGKVKLNYDIGVFNNACATRISKALNYSLGEHKIPYFKTKNASGEDVIQVSSGGKKLWYIFRVRALIEYLTQTYGLPKVVQVEKYKQSLKGKKGIIVFEVSGWDDASGHADLWDGSKVVGSDYGNKASKIVFWEAF